MASSTAVIESVSKLADSLRWGLKLKMHETGFDRFPVREMEAIFTFAQEIAALAQTDGPGVNEGLDFCRQYFQAASEKTAKETP